jgi:hypothetical protein
MIEIQITAAPGIGGVAEATNVLYDTKLRDFPACCQSLFVDGFSANNTDLDCPLWAFLDTLESVDQGILLVYLLDAIRTN